MQQAEPWNPQSPIRQECWDEFQKQRAVVFDHLAYLRTALYLLRQIAEFPFNQLTTNDDRIFFTMAARGLYETAILAVTKLTTDQGDVLTLNRFRNSVRTMLRPELVAGFSEQLKDTKFDAAAKALADRVKDLRNARIAHLTLAEVLAASTPIVYVQELTQLADDTEKLYEPLLFGASASFLPLPYDPDVRAANQPADTDIEKILNCFARQNYLLNQPEANPRVWPAQRAKMTAGEMNTFNYWRRRAGLSSV